LVIKDIAYTDALSKICLLERLERFSSINQKTLKESDASSFHSYHETYREPNKK